MPQDSKTDSLVRGAKEYKEILSEKSFLNPFGRHYRSMTARDFSLLPPKMDIAIKFIVGAIFDERYDVIDDIKPTNMSRIEFTHVMLREARLRELLPELLNNTGLIDKEYTDKMVTVRRPLGVPTDQRQSVTGPAVNLAFRDIAIDMLNKPLEGAFLLQPDIARQVGLKPNETNRIELPKDMHALIVGYMVGSDPANYPRNNPALRPGTSPVELYYDKTPSEVRTAYCASANNIANPGRSVDQTVAMSTGFIMARTDAALGYGRDVGSEKIGFGGEACSVTPPAWNKNMRVALAAQNNASRPR